MGCDNSDSENDKEMTVSIHAPVWGATIIILIPMVVFLFQSTHPCGVRQTGQAQSEPQRCFNPRTRVGCDGIPTIRFICKLFQSTHPCGVRRLYCFKRCGFQSFNPRTRVGCDNSKAREFGILWFQSTHPCGVRRLSWGDPKPPKVSIHAPVWGATPV